MIKLTHLKERSVILLNEDFIATVEQTPDTIVNLQDGRKFFVAETIDEIFEKCVEYNEIHRGYKNENKMQ
ncbi:MAG: flagellar FlbD family protein [Oscillospiraceae bacterium]|nr:flagellar FlbD family protein [Oscillospiraceae bacterium]